MELDAAGDLVRHVGPDLLSTPVGAGPDEGVFARRRRAAPGAS
jgi:hypothetical protein